MLAENLQADTESHPLRLLPYFDKSHGMTRDLVQSDRQKASGAPLPTKEEEEYTLIHTACQSLCSAFNALLELLRHFLVYEFFSCTLFSTPRAVLVTP